MPLKRKENITHRRHGCDSVGLSDRTETDSPETRIHEILRNNKLTPDSEWRNIDQRNREFDNAGATVAYEAARSKPITILIADNHPVVREGLLTLINRQPDMRVISEASNGEEVVEAFFRERPDVALLDLRMPIMDGIDAVTLICRRDPTARMVIITSYQDEEDIYRALRAGARGYILKDSTVDQLIECVHAVRENKTWVPPQVGAKLAKRITDKQLTRREIQVLHLVAVGKSNKEIGSELEISEATVKVHMTHILEKLRVAGRTEAINVAVRRGLVRIDGSVSA